MSQNEKPADVSNGTWYYNRRAGWYLFTKEDQKLINKLDRETKKTHR